MYYRYTLLVLCLVAFQPVLSQNKKYDKALKKIDAQYAEGSFAKASSGLQKLKKSISSKLGQQNNYMPGLYIREAQINLGSGIAADFESTLENAVRSSQLSFGEASTNHATTLIDVAEIYNEYGNYRLSRAYLAKADSILHTTNQLTDALKGRIGLAKAEAMICQGYCNDALLLLDEIDEYFLTRAVDKETTVNGTNIKSTRVPDAELPGRYSDYAELLTLKGNAYAQKGLISIAGDAVTVDVVFKELEGWLKGKTKYLGETSLVDVRYRYYWAKALVENGDPKNRESSLQYDNILRDLKRKTEPTNSLAHDIYLSYLRELLNKESDTRYANLKDEYEKNISKYYPKSTLHRINLEAVEFDAKLNKDKTKNLENKALALLNSKSLPKNYRTSIRILEFLYDVSLQEKRYTNAENYLTQLAEVTKELCGAHSPAYHLAAIKLANFYLDYTNKLELAGKIYEESYLKVVSKEIGEQHKDLLPILNHLATWYELTDNFQLASKTLDISSKAARAKFSDDDPAYGIELERVAELEIKLGQYEKAEQHINQSLKILEPLRKEERWLTAYVNSLETQAKLFGIKGLFEEAEANLDRSSKIIGKGGVAYADASSSAEELVPLYIQLGRYAEADKLLNTQIPQYENLYGNKSVRLINSLVFRGRILLAKGDYTEAERFAQRAYTIATSTYGNLSTKTAPTLKLLSDIYYIFGDYEKAQDNVVKAIASQEKQFTRNHIEVAKSISQLALIKFYKGDKKKDVEKLMLESLDIMASKLGKDNPQYAEILKSVAVLYISDKKYDAAFHSLTAAETIWQAKAGSKKNIHSAGIYSLTGDVYYQLKNYKKAEEFYNKGKDLYVKFFSITHPEYVKTLSKLSKVYYMQKEFKRSKSLIEESLTNYEGFIKQFFPALSEREKAKYWNTIKGDFEFYNTLAFSNLDDFKDLSKNVYEYQLLTKALLLSSSIKIRERILHSADVELKNQYNTWLQKKEQLTLALSMSPDQLIESDILPDALQREVESLEKELSQKSELFGQSFEYKRLNYEDIKKSLKPNEVALEMVRYRYFNHSFTDSVIYAALYLKNDFSKPKAILLKDGKKMETRFFKYYRNTITGRIPDEHSYNVYWKPIIDEIGQTSTIYLSADGVYNQINLEAIPTPDGGYVIDNSNIILVSNTRDLYLNKIKSRLKSTENTASMFGNPTFYVAASNDSYIRPLPGTEKEVSQVQFMLKQKGWLTQEYVEQSATEDKIKELRNPKIFHIATHGFYRPNVKVSLQEEIEGNEAVLTQNPLLRTGLLLKGAGNLMEKTNHNYNMESGILTAYEAMSLNLDKTDLVVLSACETGLGDLEAGEGVYGLQRAFLVAGAKVLVMSMFKVDDEATQKLMLLFYQKWLNTNNMRQSFIDAKKELRINYPDPIHWGAFIMIGLE